MNFLTALTALTTDENVQAIQFKNRHNEDMYIGIRNQKLAWFFSPVKAGPVFMVSNPEFLLRNDFELVYKTAARGLTYKEIKVKVAELLSFLESKET